MAGGEVRPSVYAGHLEDLYAGLERLAAAEIDALEAWIARPRGDEQEDDDVEDSRQAMPFANGRISSPPVGPDEVLESSVHPAVALHVAALRAWDLFADRGLDVIGLALLGAADAPGVDVAMDESCSIP